MRLSMDVITFLLAVGGAFVLGWVGCHLWTTVRSRGRAVI